MGLKDIADAGSKKSANLRGFLQETSKYVTFTTGVPRVITINGYTPGVDPRNPERQVVVFAVSDKGKNKTFTTGSTRLLRQLADLEERGFPVTVEITRTGEGYETDYKVKVVE